MKSYKVKIGDLVWGLKDINRQLTKYCNPNDRIGFKLVTMLRQNNLIKIQIINSKLLGVMYA